jgi:hypothetical protein
MIQGRRIRVQGLRFSVSDLGYREWGIGFKV